MMILSFYVHRPEDFPDPPPYVDMLEILDLSCERAGYEHVVLTDERSAHLISERGLVPFVAPLSNNLMKATNESKAFWLESDISWGLDSVFVGADCLVLRDFRDELPDCDLGVAYMKGHKKWRMNNGFMYVPARSREKVLPLFWEIAKDTSDEMCDDMLAIERALEPMPPEFGTYIRRDMEVSFLPLLKWNRYMARCRQTPRPLMDTGRGANVLHFMGGWEQKKELFFQWTRLHGYRRGRR